MLQLCGTFRLKMLQEQAVSLSSLLKWSLLCLSWLKRWNLALMQVPVGDLFSSEDGQCYDDMNAMLWQLYFNVAMKSDLEGEEGMCPCTSRPVNTRSKCHYNCAGSVQSRHNMLCLLVQCRRQPPRLVDYDTDVDTE